MSTVAKEYYKFSEAEKTFEERTLHMSGFRISISLILLVCGTALSYDPLYYNNLTEALQSMQMDGDVAFGYFGANSYWWTDSLGSSEEHEYSTSLGVIRFQFLGRYGLTSSHTLSVIIPGFVQLQGSGESGGIGIVDPWISLDGWLTREPRIFVRGAIRIPLKGALESGDYSESDRHFAFDGAMTIVSPLSSGSGINVEATAGLRYYLSAWDMLHGERRDSAETKPPIELRLSGFFVLPINPELSLRLGGEVATRGETEAQIDGIWSGQIGSEFSYQDLRAGFSLNNASLDLTAEVFYRLGGENTAKEWGLMISGTGLDFTDLFTSTTGSSGTR
ncbi:hypothetical protein DRQ25_02230 [Candidatus Fermentibacteria bacterium]|nr:MAG: hypothetical protein DRQ25_02230 [Candidatus Fermentibacteria bacterium]